PEQQLGTDKEEADANDEEQDEMETAARQLYLIDVNGMVVPQTLELPNIDSNEVAKQVLEYLVKDGPVTSILPNGFQAVLPAGRSEEHTSELQSRFDHVCRLML